MPKIGNCKILGCPISRETTIYSTINMYLVIEIWYTMSIFSTIGIVFRWKKIQVYMLKIHILRNSLQNSLGVLKGDF